ncbi:sodium:calcium antiporter [Natrialbaceae archaeon AArc-T1-2]|uniref:sodium:calcium antiporter n=1 Tax=Natrialbaceae archaeon AArc-T1-2 TaxID=3053904 RepID=UPI00255AF069|nr:sodium:calcium antiporter [Natrialbaceae archaeon AArc-T1-2]WIV66809.1 sodium:calcium antiporter [Natrialbaceae archaeon AArc-T1-2]
MIRVLALLGLAAVGTVVVWKGSIWLEDAADRIATGYGVPGVVQGAVIAAVGSSMPELVSVLLATLLHGEFELGIGAVVGSAVFNLLVIPGVVVLLAGSMETSRSLVYKEALFYMLAVAVLLLTFSLAVIYNPVGGDGPIQGTVTRPLALFPIALYALYVFTQYLDTTEHDSSSGVGVGIRTWLVFAAGLALIVVGVEALVRAAIGFGSVFDTPTFLWGMVVVAAGSSVPDAFVSVAAARAGRHDVSLANVLGSNTFDLLVAVPLGVVVAGALTITFEHVVPMMGFLVLATVVFFAVARTEMLLSRREATLLLALYGLFVVWILAESIGATTVVPT